MQQYGSATFKEFFKGKNIRPLKEITGLSREAFLIECAKIMEDAVRTGKAAAIEAAGGNITDDAIAKSCEETRRQVAAQLGRAYLFYFVVCILGKDWLNNDYAYRLCMDVQYNKWSQHVMIWIIAREHYKSTIITCFSTLWEIVNDPNLTYGLLSFKEPKAQDFLGIIKSEIENNDLLRYIYSEVFWQDPAKGYEYADDGRKVTWTWNNSAIEVKRSIRCKEKTIEAAGVGGGSITGAHFARLLMDDIETEDMVKTDNYIQTFTESVVNLFNAGQAENLRVTMVGTFYARNDMYSNIIKQNICDEAIIQSVFDVKTGELIKMTKEAWEAKVKSTTPSNLATQYHCDPSISESARFTLSMVNRWTPSRLDGLNIYTFVDPAGTISNKSDFTSILTVGYDALDNIMIIDLLRDRITLDKKFSYLAGIYRRYRPKTIYYEKVGMQADIDYLNARMEQFNIRFPISPITPKKGISKETRIEAIYPVMDKIFFPYNCFHNNWQGINEDMIDSFINDELLMFPQSDHDDAMDTLAMAVSAVDSGMIALPDNEFIDSSISMNEPIGTSQFSPVKYAIKKLG